MAADQNRLLEILFARLPMGIAVFDREMTLLRLNPTWAGFITRYVPTAAGQVLPGIRLFDLLPESRRGLTPLLEQALRGATVNQPGVRLEIRGQVAYWDLAFTPLIEGDQVVGLVMAAVDATGRMLGYQALEHRVEARTREIEQRRQVAEGLREILTVLNSNRPLTEVLDFIVAQGCQMLGTETAAIYRLEENGQYLTVQAARGLSPEYVATMVIPVGEGAVGRAVAERRPVAVSDMAAVLPRHDPRLDPHRRTLLVQLRESHRALLAVPLIIKDEVYGGITLYYPEVRPFSAEELALAAAFADQVALALETARLRARAEESAVAAERSRLARDLHDSVTQTLFSASLIAEVLPRLWERNSGEGYRRLDELRQLTRGALAEMRTLLLELRPAALVEASLPDLLRHLTEAITGRARVPVTLKVEGEASLPPDVQIACYRIAQEALNNVARHSGAASATVQLSLAPRRVELRVSDNGRGFDPTRPQAEHLGQRIMRERAEAIGASLGVTSRPGRGTQVMLLWEAERTGGAKP